MINSNDYITTKELEEAMFKEYQEQILKSINEKYNILKVYNEIVKNNIEFMNLAIPILNKEQIYRTADNIECYTNSMIHYTRQIKSLCRIFDEKDFNNE